MRTLKYLVLINRLKRGFALIPVIILILIGFGCKSTNEIIGSSPKEIFEKGIELLNKKKYEDAQRQFDVIKYQYPSTIYADGAHYYTGDIYFAREEFILAAFSYTYLRQHFPTSKFVRDALYKTGLSYYQISPTYDRDQNYTIKAIQTFLEFQAYYPNDTLNVEVEEKIMELRNKLANKEFFTAELYMKMDSPRAAIVYYETVINDFYDTAFYEPSFFGKIEALVKMNRRDEALSLIQSYKAIFSSGQFLGKVLELETSLLDD